jgi:hypothetical protein
MMAITTRSSMSVKAAERFMAWIFGLAFHLGTADLQASNEARINVAYATSIRRRETRRQRFRGFTVPA